ncbi:MAG: flagellar M-ring protein FliF [Silicimonas sp.]|nr:flagellar M-ring protein FliF [Silicimonas sp.]
MEQLLSVWAGLDARRRLTVAVATIGMFASVYFLTQLASQPRMALLYAGLDPLAAGEVVTALEARGAVVDIRGSAIYVDATQRDALRLALAGEGLPQNGTQGYELLDSLTGFGTTAQMFDAAYWRAKEGELARTITANRQFSAARVHISNPASDPFRQGQVDSASVSVTMSSGGLSAAQATAIRYLVASAIAGLDPQSVSVIDGVTGLIPNTEDPSVQSAGASDARAEHIRSSVTRLLEARVGGGRAVVEVTVDPVTVREEITERRFEPDTRVPISSDTEETTTRSTNTGSGSVTVASNLPEGDAGGSAGSSENSETRSREVVNFEVSETQRAILKEPGSVRRISVAVLVDGVRTTAANGTEVWEPRSAEELADLRELVTSAIGYDEARGDQVIIRSMEFQPLPELAPPVPLSLLDRFAIDVMSLIQLGVVALVGLILGLFVVRPILMRPPATQAPQLLPPNADLDLPEGAGANLPALDGEIDGLGGFTPLDDLPSFDSIQSPGQDPADRLRQLIETKQDETVEVLSQWMNDSHEVAR